MQYTVSEPGRYHVISFNDDGDFGVTRNPDEIGQPYIFVEYEGSADNIRYTFDFNILIVQKTCVDVEPGGTCIARCPEVYEPEIPFYNAVYPRYLSGGACSTSDVVEADAFVGPRTYSCTVPTYSGEVIAQGICVVRD